ncbi:MAG: sulfite exporter TauE/SafE family protein [Alphaproteobacteria bacterium]|nr:sulfite exporter TauE/SafE family protein [Alphaproteobacteria bacterium]
MIGIVGAAALAGLLGSPHCVGMCGGFAGACARPAGHAASYHLGRLLTYGTLGASAGTLGALLPVPGEVLTVLSGLLLVVFAGALAGVIPSPAPRLPGVTAWASAALRRGGRLGSLGLGAATALLPCGLVYAALGVSLAAASPAWSAAAMVAFGLGTIPLLAGASVGLRRLVAQRPWARRALAAGVLAAGAWSLVVRGPVTAEAHVPQADAHGQEAPPACH